MSPGPTYRSHEEVAQVLRHAGYPDDFIREVLAELPDPVELERDDPILARFGLGADRLMQRLGSSP
jgi:hypothetical protein